MPVQKYDYAGQLFLDAEKAVLRGSIVDRLGATIELECEWDDSRRAYVVRGAVLIPPWQQIEGLDE